MSNRYKKEATKSILRLEESYKKLDYEYATASEQAKKLADIKANKYKRLKELKDEIKKAKKIANLSNSSQFETSTIFREAGIIEKDYMARKEEILRLKNKHKREALKFREVIADKNSEILSLKEQLIQQTNKDNT